jgi:hypothetical protein
MSFPASGLTDLQTCPRRFLLSREFHPRRWRPKLLLDACLRKAILDMSSGLTVEEASGDAMSRFLQTSANPGIDVLGNPYYVAKEWSVLLGVLVHAMQRVGIPNKLSEGSTVDIGDQVPWKLTALMDDSGILHRYITLDRWTKQRVDRELHSWFVAGDIAASARKLVLHVIEIGSVRDGHRSSVWVRGWRHPKMFAHQLRFKKKMPTGDFSGWLPVRLASMGRSMYMDLSEWVDRIWKDQAGEELIHSLEIQVPSEKERTQVLRDMREEYRRGKSLSGSWKDVPMSRAACDDLVPCPYKLVCYDGVDPEVSGFFVPVKELSATNSR